MKDDTVYLHHILNAIEQVEHYLDGVDASTFFAENMRQDAVVRQLEIIGEASRRLSESFRSRHAAIPWRAIIGMRNRIAHDYLNIDVHVVWDVARHDLPDLKARLQAILSK